MRITDNLSGINLHISTLTSQFYRQKKHTHLIEQIRTKVIEMEQHEWKVEFSWIKAHAGHRRNELADQLAKEAASSKTMDECYNRIPKSAVLCELNEQTVHQWQNEWARCSKVKQQNLSSLI